MSVRTDVTSLVDIIITEEMVIKQLQKLRQDKAVSQIADYDKR